MSALKTALLLAGPSGGGKTTVMNELLKSNTDFELVRSATTRERRGDGNDGEYIYLSRNEFLLRCENGEMLEFTEYGGNLYGTPYSEIERISGSGKTPILILDLSGVKTLRTRILDFGIYAVYVYAEPKTLAARLAARYSEEGGEKSMRYITRMENNLRDYAAADEWCPLFDTAVESLDIDKTKSAVLSAFPKEKNPPLAKLFVKMAEDFEF